MVTLFMSLTVSSFKTRFSVTKYGIVCHKKKRVVNTGYELRKLCSRADSCSKLSLKCRTNPKTKCVSGGQYELDVAHRSSSSELLVPSFIVIEVNCTV